MFKKYTPLGVPLAWDVGLRTGLGHGLLAKGLCKVCRSAMLQRLLNVGVITFLNVISEKSCPNPFAHRA